MAVVGLAAVGSAYWWGPALLRHASYFDVRNVQVVGARYLEPDEVARALATGVTHGQSVWAPLGPMEAAVQRLPGVVAARVSRRLPGTLVVRVVERSPVALAQGPLGLVAVGDSGEPLGYGGANVDAPVVRQPDARLVRALTLIQQLDLALFDDIASADFDGGIELVLKDSGSRIRLADPVSPVQLRAVGVVRRELASHARAWRELDGRFANLVVVRV